MDESNLSSKFLDPLLPNIISVLSHFIALFQANVIYALVTIFTWLSLCTWNLKKWSQNLTQQILMLTTYLPSHFPHTPQIT